MCHLYTQLSFADNPLLALFISFHSSVWLLCSHSINDCIMYIYTHTHNCVCRFQIHDRGWAALHPHSSLDKAGCSLFPLLSALSLPAFMDLCFPVWIINFHSTSPDKLAAFLKTLSTIKEFTFSFQHIYSHIPGFKLFLESAVCTLAVHLCFFCSAVCLVLMSIMWRQYKKKKD